MPHAFDQLEWPHRTERLTLRPARAEDAAELWIWQQLPEVTEWLPAAPANQAAHSERFLKGLPHTLVAEHDGRLVAGAKLVVENAWSQAEVEEQARNQQAELGWTVDPTMQGQGIATELALELTRIAFDELGVHRVVAYCFADNTASRRVMAKIGMRHEATFVAESLHRSGRWVDGAGYAILASEWRKIGTVPLSRHAAD